MIRNEIGQSILWSLCFVASQNGLLWPSLGLYFVELSMCRNELMGQRPVRAVIWKENTFHFCIHMPAMSQTEIKMGWIARARGLSWILEITKADLPFVGGRILSRPSDTEFGIPNGHCVTHIFLSFLSSLRYLTDRISTMTWVTTHKYVSVCERARAGAEIRQTSWRVQTAENTHSISSVAYCLTRLATNNKKKSCAPQKIQLICLCICKLIRPLGACIGERKNTSPSLRS